MSLNNFPFLHTNRLQVFLCAFRISMKMKLFNAIYFWNSFIPRRIVHAQLRVGLSVWVSESEALLYNFIIIYFGLFNYWQVRYDNGMEFGSCANAFQVLPFGKVMTTSLVQILLWGLEFCWELLYFPWELKCIHSILGRYVVG